MLTAVNAYLVLLQNCPNAGQILDVFPTKSPWGNLTACINSRTANLEIHLRIRAQCSQQGSNKACLVYRAACIFGVTRYDIYSIIIGCVL